jgi:hypothetical protein
MRGIEKTDRDSKVIFYHSKRGGKGMIIKVIYFYALWSLDSGILLKHSNIRSRSSDALPSWITTKAEFLRARDPCRQIGLRSSYN